jgi:hypothetical protein
MLPHLSKDDRRRLLELARAALTEVILRDRLPDVPAVTGRLGEPAGAFVTLHCRARLRGCVGMTAGRLPLAETVVQAAVSAARNDPRFPPVQPEELLAVEIEISVLSEPQPIAAAAIEIGKHGLLVTSGDRRGLLLPQVAVERSWSAGRFLEETCRKAGLGAESWRHPDTVLLAFTAEIFSEREVRAEETGAAESRAPVHESEK